MKRDDAGRSDFFRSFRLVCSPDETGLVRDLLLAQGFELKNEPYFSLARGGRGGEVPLGSSLAAEFGLIYIQDRSSMLPPLALDPPPGAAVLDMCASPGSKTSLLAQLVGEEGFILANEPNRDRLANLRRNLARMNLFQAATCPYPGESIPLPSGLWPYILLDPPCSGWGTAEKHPRVKKIWKGDKVKPLAGLQRKLLAEAARLLKPGGRMVYSTCTTNPEENEDQIVWAIENLGLEVSPLPRFPGFAFSESLHPKVKGCLTVDQDKSEGQGFFLAALTKPGGEEEQAGRFESNPWPGQAVSASLLGDCGLDPGKLPPGRMRMFNQRIYFIPGPALEILPPEFHWQGFPMGRLTKNGPRFSPRLRRLMSAPGPGDLNVDDPKVVLSLLGGVSLEMESGSKTPGLYYKSLPLAKLRAKGGRVLWSDR